MVCFGLHQLTTIVGCLTITKETKVADTVAEVLQKSIQLLPPNIQNTVKVVSFLGFRFNKKLLDDVVLAM
jgi:predicted ATPase